MFFNPLFIPNASAGSNAINNVDSAKEGKFTNSSYLFADIINVSKEEVSNSELNLELDEKNLSLFNNNLESTPISLPKKSTTNKNQFLGNVENLTSFLSNFSEEGVSQSSDALNKQNKSDSDDISVIPEQIALLVDQLNSGKKISLPIDNNGETIFVEIENFNPNSATNETSSKNIKLTNSENNGIKFSELDFEKIITDINLAIKESFGSDDFNMNEEKLEAIVSKIENDFSKLETVQNDAFRPQKNILGNLINNVEKEFNLSVSESGELKDIIVAQFVKVVNEVSGKENLQQNNKGTNENLASLDEISNKLSLNSNEKELIKNTTTTTISTSQLKKELEVKLSESSNNSEVKTVLDKLNKYIKVDSSQPKDYTISEKLSTPEVAKEINLNTKEVQALNKLTSEKISLPELNKELKVEITKPNATHETKALVQKLDKYLTDNKVDAQASSVAEKLNVKDVAKELNLTPKENKLISELKIEKVDLQELQKSLKTEIIKNPEQSEFKALLSKLEKFETFSQNNITKPVVTNNTVAKTKIVDKVESGNKDIVQSTDVQTSKNDNLKAEYLFTLKNERTHGSLAVDKNLVVEKKNPELLKTSIYSSKESAELTKVKIVPITNEVSKNELRTSDSNHKEAILKKVNTEHKIASPKGSNNKSAFNNNSFQNEQSLNKQEITSPEVAIDDWNKQSFNKEVTNYSNTEIKKETQSPKEAVKEVSLNSNDIKVGETSLPKASFVEHQIRNQSLNINERTIYKKIDIKNFKEEVSNLIQKGEKKSVEFQLNPENLGKVSVKLEVANKIVSASIKVDNETTQQMLQNSMEGLKTSLNQSGVQFNSLNVSLANSEDKNQRYFKQKRKNNNNAKMTVEGFDEKFTHKNLGYNNYDFIA